jgi:hypothetical protein
MPAASALAVALPRVQIRHDHRVSLASQPVRQLLDLHVESPGFVQDYQARIGSLCLRPEEQGLDLRRLGHAGEKIGIHGFVGNRRDRPDAGKAGGLGADLIEREGDGSLRHGCFGLFVIDRRRGVL